MYQRRKNFSSRTLSTREFRARTILSEAYPEFPFDGYNSNYIGDIAIVLPGLVNELAPLPSGSGRRMSTSHGERISLWLDDVSKEDIAYENAVKTSAIQAWLGFLPKLLRENVSVYDVVHAADELTPEDYETLATPSEPQVG